MHVEVPATEAPPADDEVGSLPRQCCAGSHYSDSVRSDATPDMPAADARSSSTSSGSIFGTGATRAVRQLQKRAAALPDIERPETTAEEREMLQVANCLICNWCGEPSEGCHPNTWCEMIEDAVAPQSLPRFNGNGDLRSIMGSITGYVDDEDWSKDANDDWMHEDMAESSRSRNDAAEHSPPPSSNGPDDADDEQSQATEHEHDDHHVKCASVGPLRIEISTPTLEREVIRLGREAAAADDAMSMSGASNRGATPIHPSSALSSTDSHVSDLGVSIDGELRAPSTSGGGTPMSMSDSDDHLSPTTPRKLKSKLPVVEEWQDTTATVTKDVLASRGISPKALRGVARKSSNSSLPTPKRARTRLSRSTAH